jgi:hypothetical protein
MNLKENGYCIIKNAVSLDVCRILAKEFELLETSAFAFNLPKGYGSAAPEYATYDFPYNDHQVRNSFAWYSPLAFEALSDTIVKEHVENLLGEEVYPTYTYGRIYYNNAEMKIHKDRVASDFAVSCCLSVDELSKPWPLGFIDKLGNRVLIEQTPGDIVIYQGDQLEHWRDQYSGQKQIQCFLFYVTANGPRAELKYDTRPSLGLPSTFRRIGNDAQDGQFIQK